MTRLLRLLLPAVVVSSLPAQQVSEKYHDAATKLISMAQQDEEGLDRLEYLCDRIGNRVSGSASLEKAIDWAVAEMKKAGFENV